MFTKCIFQVLDESCLGGTALAHEMGHNLGLDHDRANAISGSEKRSNYGFTECHANGFSTIMSYRCKNRVKNKNGKLVVPPAIHFFSDPHAIYNGRPVGRSTSEDNVWVLRQNYKKISGFRPHRFQNGNLKK